MKNINKVREKFKKGTLLLFILFVVIATKGFCAINDSNNNTYSRATKSPNKQTVEKDKVVLGIIEANQLKANGLFQIKM